MHWCTQGPIYHASLYRSREKTVLEKLSMCSTHIFSILGVGNQRLRVIGKLNLSVNINGKCFDFNVHVIDTLSHSLIVQIYIVKANKVTLNLSHNSMKSSENNAKICLLEKNSGLEDSVLPAGSDVVLPVHVSWRNQGEQVLWKPISSILNKRSTEARCVVQVNNSKS